MTPAVDPAADPAGGSLDGPVDAPASERSTYSYLCIGCPLGCRLEVDEAADGEIVEVRGFSCRKGKEFAVQEHTDPRRLVTTTVAVTGARWPRLPVKTTTTVPRDRVLDVCAALRRVRVRAPVRNGDVIVADVLGTGADVVATRDLPAVGE
jgi:CxxC motif-containing protein